MNRSLLLILIFSLLTLSIGCSKDSSGAYDVVNGQIHAKGVTLGMGEKELFGSLGQVDKENCVYGSECVFETQKLVIGLDFDGNVRRIRIEDPSDDIYGIKPGMTLEEAEKIAVDAGYVKVEGTKKFTKDGIVLELLSMENKRADKVSLEIEPKN